MRSSTGSRSTSSPFYVCQTCNFWLARRRPACQRPFSLFRQTKGKRTDPKKEVKDAKPEVKWFDQVPNPDGKTYQIVPEGNDPETQDLKARIDKLEDDLKNMRDGGVLAIPSLLAHMVEQGGIDASDPPSSRAAQASGETSIHEDLKLLKRLAESMLTGKDIASDGSRNISRSTVTMKTRREQRIYLNRLNGYLKQAEAMGHDEDTRKQLWRWFARCKQNIPNFLRRVSPETWKTLWNAQSAQEPSNVDRAAHLIAIASDMQASGHDLSPEQRIGYIEALSDQNESTKAIDEWTAGLATLGSNKMISDSFFSLGVQMFASVGDVQRAHDIAYSALNDGKVEDPGILIPLIEAWARDGGIIALRKAWAAYIRLREELGSEMDMDDYDSVCKSFLHAGRADLALGVFKDMMLHGDESKGDDSSVLYLKALQTVGEMQSIASDALELNKISLEALTVLPRRFQNKFFFGSWIKKLLGEDEVDSAALVVELMVARRVQPDPKYLNGIIAAWIRNKDGDSFTKAEAMAWRMIEKRKEFAWKRRALVRASIQQDRPIATPSETGLSAKEWGFETSANLETFSILIDYYWGRQKHDQIRWLHRSLRLAEIEPDAFFMTRLLRSQLGTDGLRKVWQTYMEWAHWYGSKAKRDFEVFEFLWNCALRRAELKPSLGRQVVEEVETSPSKHEVSVSDREGDFIATGVDAGNSRPFDDQLPTAKSAAGFPSPRVLFNDMISWFVGLSVKQKEQHRGEFTQAIYDQVIQSLLLDHSGDLVGVLVAMHAMNQHFGTFPHEAVADRLVANVAKNEQQRSTSPHPDGRHAYLVQVAERLGELAAERMMLLEEHGFGGDDDDDDDDGSQADNDELFKAKENLTLLSTFLRDVLLRKGDVAQLEHAVQRAAWDMGVGGIETGDHLRLS